MEDAVLTAFLKGVRKEGDKIRAIYLFGSRARGDFLPDSDYDVLIVTRERDLALKDRIYDVATDVSLQARRDLSLKFFTEAEVKRLQAVPSRFIRHVLTEGIKIG